MAKREISEFYQAMWCLLDMNDIDSISINELCKKANRGRSSFYRLVVDKYELAWTTLQLYTSTSGALDTETPLNTESVRLFLSIASQHSARFQNVLSSSAASSPRRRLVYLFAAKTLLHFKQAGFYVRDEQLVAQSMIFAYEITGALIAWLGETRAITTDRMVQTYADRLRQLEESLDERGNRRITA